MTYHIKIKDDSTEQSRVIILLLKTLAKQYPILQIEEADSDLTDAQMAELDFRYELMQTHAHEYREWNDIKHKYLKI